MNVRGCRVVIVVCALAVGAGACSPNGGGPVERQEWTLDEADALRIGAVDGDPSFLFLSISTIRLMPDGRVAVADLGRGSIRIFGADGSFQREFGRRGEGPGEFSYLGSIELHPPDTIAAYDGSLYRRTVFDADGELLETVNLRPAEGSPGTALGRRADGTHAFAWIDNAISRDLSQSSADVMGLGVFDVDGSFLRRLATHPGMRRVGRGPVPFSPFLHAFAVGDSIFATDGDVEMSVVGPEGAVARTFALPESNAPVGDARTNVRDRLVSDGNDMMVQLLDEADVPDSIPRVAEVLLDDTGHFWMKAYDPATDSHLLGGFGEGGGGTWRVISAAGDVVAEIELPDGFVPRDVRGGRVAGVSRDELDVQTVAVYRIVTGS